MQFEKWAVVLYPTYQMQLLFMHKAFKPHNKLVLQKTLEKLGWEEGVVFTTFLKLKIMLNKKQI